MSTTQDYQAAEQLLRRPARPGELVIGDKVRPQWIDGGGGLAISAACRGLVARLDEGADASDR